MLEDIISSTLQEIEPKMDSKNSSAAAASGSAAKRGPSNKTASSTGEQQGLSVLPAAAGTGKGKGKAKPNPDSQAKNQLSKAKPNSDISSKTPDQDAIANFKIPKVKEAASTSKSPVGDDSDVRLELAKLKSMIATLVDAQNSALGKAKGLGIDPSQQQPSPQELELSGTDGYVYDTMDMGTDSELDYEHDDSVLVAGQAEAECSPSNPENMAKPSTKIPVFAAKFAVPTGVGEHLDEEIANTAKFYLQEALDETALDETYKRYPMPGNCLPLKTPKVNPTVWENLSTPTRTRDLKLQKIEKALTAGITAFASTLEAATLTEAQNDALGLLCHANYELNHVRRNLIKPELDANCSQLCKPSNPVTDYLFRDDLGRQVKELQEQKKTVAGVMKGHRMRPSKQFNPYKKPTDNYRSQPYARSWASWNHLAHQPQELNVPLFWDSAHPGSGNLQPTPTPQ